MDFDKLHEPYKSDDSPSVTAQIGWLQKKGIPSNIIDQALLIVYDQLSRGKVIEATATHSAGFMLDNYILGIAQGMVKQEADARKAQLNTFLKGFRTKWEDDLVALAKANGTDPTLPTGSMFKKKLARYSLYALAAQGAAYEIWQAVKPFLGW